MHRMSFENNIVKRNGGSLQKRKGTGILTRLKDSFGHGSSVKSTITEFSNEGFCSQATTALCAPTLDTASDVKVTIAIQKRVNFGERIAVVGETAVLGRWRPCDGVPLTWSDGDVWSAEVILQPGLHEFKCITLKPDGRTEWELGNNRTIEVPAEAGALQARCQWADTARTTLVAAPSVPEAYEVPRRPPVASTAPDQPLLSTPQPYRMDSVSEGSSIWSAQSTDAAVDVESLASAMDDKRLCASAYEPQGCSVGDADSTAESNAVCESDADVTVAKLDQQACDDEQKLSMLQTAYVVLGAQESSGDLSSYACDYSNSSESNSDGLLLDLSCSEQKQRVPAADGIASLVKATELDSSSVQSATEGPGELDDTCNTEAQQLLEDSILPRYVQLDEGSAFRTAAACLFSPVSTTSTRPLRGAMSLSALSYTSMELSDAFAVEESGAGSNEAPAAGAGYAAGAAGNSDGMGEVVSRDDDSLSDLLMNPLVFEQLMAVETVQLPSQQQQQQSLAGSQAVQGSGVPDTLDSVFAAATAAAAVAAAEREAQDAITDAAATVCGFNDGDVLPELLFKEDTLPPAALLKFTEVSVSSDMSAPAFEATVEGSEEGEALLDASASVSAPLDDLRQDSSSFVSSSNSSFSSLTKDQLPDLGLTVTVPTAADKAAAKAAEMSAANAVAAAAAAAVKDRSGWGAADDLLEPPVAQEGLRLLSAAHMIPHVDKAATGGEDAYFISLAGHGAVGVSDGVSAWAEDGIDPGEYSRTLVQYCSEAFEERVMAATRAANKGSFIQKFDPRSILRYAQQCTCKPGSATVVLAALQPGGKLHVANLGDCGVKVVRNGKIVYETQPQQHDFNLPYQLSHPRLFPDTDTADSADRYAWDVEEGDVIVAASDGLFDNIWDDELLMLLQQALIGVSPDSGLDCLSQSNSKLLRSRSFAALSRNSSIQSNSSASSSIPPAGAACSTGGSNSNSGITRSRSTSNIASWGAKQLRQWKGKTSKSMSATAAAAAQYSVLEECENVSDCDVRSSGDQSAVVAAVPVKPRTTAECSADDVARAAEILAAAAAAHAADKEFKSPWSVAAGKAYGLLARLFAKGGKMDDITCVVAVVQDAKKSAEAESPGSAGTV